MQTMPTMNKNHKIILEEFKKFPEYKLIERYYDTQIAERSGVPKLNHIHEGLIILDQIEASVFAKKAYCLHPLLQNDVDLKNNYRREIHTYEKEDRIDFQSIILAMEYRAVANSYLSNREISNIKEIKLSPLREVNEMLIADKVQNYKDFIKYHEYTHDRRRELFTYFHNWFEALRINQNVETLVNTIKEY
jgi:hypothetical protein